MTPAAKALLQQLRERPLPSADFTDAHLEPMRELCRMGFADLYEPPPYEWRATMLGRAKGTPDV